MLKNCWVSTWIQSKTNPLVLNARRCNQVGFERMSCIKPIWGEFPDFGTHPRLTQGRMNKQNLNSPTHFCQIGFLTLKHTHGPFPSASGIANVSQIARTRRMQDWRTAGSQRQVRTTLVQVKNPHPPNKNKHTASWQNLLLTLGMATFQHTFDLKTHWLF